MSFTIYVANEGGKDKPISQDAWRAASKKCNGLIVNHHTKKDGKESFEVFLPGKRKRYIWLNPYGVIATQRPNEEVIHVMFALAKELNANVYNENFKKYSSFDDWERKTRHDRRQADQEKRIRVIRQTLKVALLACAGIVGWFLKDIITFMQKL